MKISDVALLIKGNVEGNGDVDISGLSGPTTAKANDLTFATDEDKLAIAEKRRFRALKQAEKTAGPKPEAPKMDEKAVDEKLEEIIEKL